MSSLIVEVCKVDAVEPHPQADRMCVATVKGWKTCIRKGTDGPQFKPGDLCVFIPPDTVMGAELAGRLGVAGYLKQLAKDASGARPPGGRVGVARLRGQPSYGLIAETGVLPPRPDGLAWGPGDSVVEALGLSKWEPPITCTDGDALPDHPGFPRYYGMENWRNFPDLFQDGEEVAITEKVHGKNCRFGLVRDAGEDGSMSWTWMAGSHDVRRKETATRRKKKRDPETGEEAVAEWQEKPVFWQALDLPGIRVMMEAISARQRSVVVFGEIYGSGVQDMAYGYEGGRWHFRAFDIMVDGQYLGVKDKLHWLHTFAVPTVPFLYHGPYSAARVEELVDGPTTVPGGGTVGGAVHGFAGREGVVITSAVERAAATASHVHQRAVLKAVSFAYLERKNPDPTEDH